MKKRIKKKWLKALRSGEYQQGTGGLREGSGEDTAFCCLGVLCNIHAQENPEIAAKERNSGVYMGQFGYLPIEVGEWAGLKTKLIAKDDGGQAVDVEVTYRNNYTTLATLNDEEELTFKQIANVIERCL